MLLKDGTSRHISQRLENTKQMPKSLDIHCCGVGRVLEFTCCLCQARATALILNSKDTKKLKMFVEIKPYADIPPSSVHIPANSGNLVVAAAWTTIHASPAKACSLLNLCRVMLAMLQVCGVAKASGKGRFKAKETFGS